MSPFLVLCGLLGLAAAGPAEFFREEFADGGEGGGGAEGVDEPLGGWGAPMGCLSLGSGRAVGGAAMEEEQGVRVEAPPARWTGDLPGGWAGSSRFWGRVDPVMPGLWGGCLRCGWAWGSSGGSGGAPMEQLVGPVRGTTLDGPMEADPGRWKLIQAVLREKS